MLDRANHTVYHQKIQIAEVDMKYLGFAMLAAVFAGLFVFTAQSHSYTHAAISWGISILVTAIIYVSINLIVD